MRVKRYCLLLSLVSNSVPGFSEVHTLKSFVVLWGFGVHDVWPGMLFLTSKLQTVSWHTRRDSSSCACNSARASSTRLAHKDHPVDESLNFLRILITRIYGIRYGNQTPILLLAIAAS